MIIADSSGLIAYYTKFGAEHNAVTGWVARNDPHLVLSPFVIAEVDYMVVTRMGVEVELAVLREFVSGAYELATIDADDLAAAARLVARYRDLGIGITDASLVVLAERYRTRTILTLDHKHFGVVRPLSGGRFKLVP